MLGDLPRSRAIYELALSQQSMDMPELLWKSYIDLEFGEEEWERTRDLYERLIRRTSHVKVWVSFGLFEGEVMRREMATLRGEDSEDDDEEDGEEGATKVVKEAVVVDEAEVERVKVEGMERARKVFLRGYADLKQKSLKEEVSPSLPLSPPPYYFHYSNQ